MPIHRIRQRGDSDGWVIAQALRDRACPGGRAPVRWLGTLLNKLANGLRQLCLGEGATASLGQPLRVSAGRAADPTHDRTIRQPNRSKPIRVEFDLDLLETIGSRRIAMRGTRSIKNSRRCRYGALSNLGAVDIRPHHKQGNHGPRMSVFRHLGLAWIDNTSKGGTREILLH